MDYAYKDFYLHPVTKTVSEKVLQIEIFKEYKNKRYLLKSTLSLFEKWKIKASLFEFTRATFEPRKIRYISKYLLVSN